MTLAEKLHAPLEVCRPVVAGSLAVFPIIAPRRPRTHYVTFAAAQGAHDGVAVTELDEGASVGDLVVTNPLGAAILLYDGEELLGAMQNRTLDQSVLVAPHTRQRVPVTCVEQGRWDGRRRRDRFRPAPQAAHPELRRRKNASLRGSLGLGREGRAAQGEVWQAVATKAQRMAAPSATGALHDVFEGRRSELHDVQSAFEMGCSQVGTLAAIGGRFVVLDYVSDVEAFATLHDRLIAGYALDALEADGAVSPPSLDDAREFVALLLRAEPADAPAVALGRTLRFEFGALAGTGLEHDGGLVTLTAFA